MTDDEREILLGLQRDMDELMKFRAAFMELPIGSDKEDKPLLEEIRTVVRAWAWLSRTSRVLVILTPIVTTIGGAIAGILFWIKTGGMGQ